MLMSSMLTMLTGPGAQEVHDDRPSGGASRVRKDRRRRSALSAPQSTLHTPAAPPRPPSTQGPCQTPLHPGALSDPPPPRDPVRPPSTQGPWQTPLHPGTLSDPPPPRDPGRPPSTQGPWQSPLHPGTLADPPPPRDPGRAPSTQGPWQSPLHPGTLAEPLHPGTRSVESGLS